MFRATKELRGMKIEPCPLVQGNKRISNLVHTTCATTEMAARHENTSDLRKKDFVVYLQSFNVFMCNVLVPTCLV